MSVRFVEVSLSLRVRLGEAQLAAHLAAKPAEVGRALAAEVDAYVRRERLGYYPALEFFRTHGGIDESLVEYAQEIGRLSTVAVRDEALRKLRAVFATVRFDSLQSLAFAMPTVRPRQPNSLALLARHYTPDTVRVDLGLTLLQQRGPQAGLERYAENVVARWLKPSFEHIEFASARLES